MLPRRKTRTCKIGNLKLGWGHPVAIQTMCTTKTEDVAATIAEMKTLQGKPCDIIRLAIPTEEAAKAIPKIKERMRAEGIEMPIVADIHFQPDLAIAALNYGVDKIRINPGNFYDRSKLEEVIATAKKHKAAIRIGINTGSLEKDLLDKYGHPTPEALVESALRWSALAEGLDFQNFIVSIKSSDAQANIEANRLFARQTDIPLHLGVTEAGPLLPGSIKSAIGIGTLLQEGIGDTIRVSLTDSIVTQVDAAKFILKTFGLYSKEPDIVSCPSCGRCEIDLPKLVAEVDKALAHIKKPIRVSVLGCAVNGPGEARESDFGVAGGKDRGAIYYKGEVYKANVPEAELLPELLKLIEEKIKTEDL